MSGIALAIGIGAAATVGTSLYGASKQSDAAHDAASLNYQAQQDALNYQKSKDATNAANQQPWLNAGTGAIANLAYLTGTLPSNSLSSQGNTAGYTAGSVVRDDTSGGIYQNQNGEWHHLSPEEWDALHIPWDQVQHLDQSQASQVLGGKSLSQYVNPALGSFGSLLQPYQGEFKAPTAEEAAATPGYQFALQQGLQGVERGAAARGNLLGGGEQKALEQYGQGLASTNYQQTFNNALQQYQTAYNQFQQGQANTYNRLAGVAGTGQVTAQSLGQQGQQSAQNAGNILQSGAAYQGNNLQNAAYQTASGYNAAAGGLQGLYGQYQLGKLLNQPSGPSFAPGTNFDMGGGTGYGGGGFGTETLGVPGQSPFVQP